MDDKKIKTRAYSQLHDFLSKHAIQKKCENKQFTHTSLGYPKRSYEILDERSGKMMDLYCRALAELDNSRSTDHNLYLSERHVAVGPIIIDVDIKYHLPEECSDHRYTIDDIKILIDLYNKQINEYLNVDTSNMDVYLLEKKSATFKNETAGVYNYKDGVHIIYPFICTPPNIQYIIRENVINEIKKTCIWNHLLMDNTIEDVIDKAVIEKNNWLMYGSAKPGVEDNKYVLSQIMHFDGTIIDPDELSMYDKLDLPKTLSIRKFTTDDITPLREGYDWKKIENIFCSLSCFRKRKEVNVGDSDIATAHVLVNMLSHERINDYQKWIELGFCLHNIDDSLLELWDEFSSASSKYKQGECERLWHGFRKYGFTIRSLYRWARMDSPHDFEAFMIDKLSGLMKTSLTGTSYDVAATFYEKYKDDYVCGSIAKNIWYEFRDHRWVKVSMGYTIIRKINEDLVNDFLKMGENYGARAIDALGEDKDNYLQKQQAAIKLCHKMRGADFKNSVMSELRNIFHIPEFIEELDERRDLICFTNGIYDLENGIFREGRPDDKISKCTGWPYMPYDANNPVTHDILKFFRSVMEDEAMYEYLLDAFTGCLQGDNPEEKFHICTGSGGNGKSIAFYIMQKGFGEYSCILPITILTNKRPPSDAPCPALALSKGCRIGFFQEGEDDDKLYVAHLKELTSNTDKLKHRTLYAEPVEWYSQLKLFMATNHLPKASTFDGGVKRRLVLLPFDMSFVDNPMLPHERKIDRTIKTKIQTWAPYFMGILIERFKTYKTKGLSIPKRAAQFTADYEKECDLYAEFIENNIKKSENPKDSFDINCAYKTFREWYRNVYAGGSVPPFKDFKKNIQQKFNKRVQRIPGYKLVPMNFNGDADDIEFMDDDILDVNTATVTLKTKPDDISRLDTSSTTIMNTL